MPHRTPAPSDAANDTLDASSAPAGAVPAAPGQATGDAPQADAPTGSNADTGPVPALSADDLDFLDELLGDLRSRSDEIPQWEFCDGFLTALVCTRRTIAPAEYLPMLLGDGEALEVDAGTDAHPGTQANAAEGGALPLLPVFASAEQQAQFLHLWNLRWHEVAQALDTPVDQLDDEHTFEPEVLDMRGAIASLPEEERAELQGQDIPSFGQVWALGFMFAVENWPDEWQAPRDKEAANWLDDALGSIVALTEDDTAAPALNMYAEDGPPSVSNARVEIFGEAIWAVYDLRQLWKSMGPRVPTLRKAPEPGRNDPCPCGSGKKFKKCCGAT